MFFIWEFNASQNVKFQNDNSKGQSKHICGHSLKEGCLVRLNSWKSENQPWLQLDDRVSQNQSYLSIN